MGSVFVLGAATSCFGRDGRTAADLGHEAVTSALDASGHDPRDIAALFVSCRGAGATPSADARGIRAALVRAGVGTAATSFEGVSRSAALALHRAWRAVDAGQHRVVLCVGAQGAAEQGEGNDAATARRRGDAASSYLKRTDATVDHLARAAVKNYRHGARNPAAAEAREVALREVLESEPVAGPLTRMMVTRRSAGAAALILGDARPARRAVRLRASVLADDGDGDAGALAAQLAYWEAGVGPEDLDCAEVHDDTAAAELAAYETLQLAPPGHGSDLIESGFTALGGVLPVNTSGGLLSLGQADGASGIAQVCELVLQLGGAAGERQVPGARLALAHTLAPAHNDDCFAAVTVVASE